MPNSSPPPEIPDWMATSPAIGASTLRYDRGELDVILLLEARAEALHRSLGTVSSLVAPLHTAIANALRELQDLHPSPESRLGVMQRSLLAAYKLAGDDCVARLVAALERVPAHEVDALREHAPATLDSVNAFLSAIGREPL